MNIETVILQNLVNWEDFGRKTIPFLKSDYFHDPVDRSIYTLIDNYVKKYNRFPSKEALLVDLANTDNISDDQYVNCDQLIKDIPDSRDHSTNIEWLLDQTEKFCQDKAIYNAIMQSIRVMDDKTGKLSKGSIPQLLTDALGVSFDTSIGHDFLTDADARYEFYHRKEERIPFDLEILNNITRGGLPRKTLNIALAGTGVGKSLFMCHCAANNLTQGRNVLYITLEMSEEKIAERIDANLLNVKTEDLANLTKPQYDKKIAALREKTIGKLIIKEYPTACAGSANFRHLLNELQIKKNFVPDIIYIDYLNICTSSRLKQGSNINSYTFIKAIAEELRGLAVEFNVPIVSATQTTRGGFGNSDVGLEDTSESFGLPATADFMFALIGTEELSELQQIMVKQLKNRYADPENPKRFVIGIDKAKMRLYDVEYSAQANIMGAPQAPAFNNSKFNERSEDDFRNGSKFDRNKYKDFK